MGRNVTIKAIAIPVPSADGKIPTERQGNFAGRTAPDDAIGLSSIRFASAFVPFTVALNPHILAPGAQP